MALDRHGERSGEGVSQMIARKQYNRAIEVLRVRLQQRRPDPKTRLRLADLLVQAGRGQEAVPILLALADDFAADGFVAKAVAVLKRVEKIRPNQAEVNQRLDRLALQRDRALAVPSSVLEPEGAAPTPLPSPPTRAPRPVPTPEAGTDEDDEPAAPSETVVRRMRGLLGRLLGGRQEGPGARSEATQPGPPHLPVPTDAGPELDASAFLPRSFTQIPSAPALLPAPVEAPLPEAPEERREEPPALEAIAPPPAPEAEPAVAPEAAVPPPLQDAEAAALPEPEPALEAATAEATQDAPPPPSEVVPDQPALVASEAEAEAASTPEGGGFRGFLGRLWGRRREDLPSAGPAPVEEKPAEPIAAEPAAETSEPAPLAAPEAAPEPSSEATREAAAEAAPVAVPEAVQEAVTPLSAAPESVPESAAPREPPDEALPMVEPDSDVSAALAPAPASSEPPLSEADFHERLLDVVQEALVRPAPLEARPTPGGPAIDPRRLHTSPLLVELDDEELRQLVHDLQLRTCEPGDIVLTEGEPGETLFLLVGGSVKVFVRNPKSRNVEVRELGEGDFFGEVGFLSGRPRMATVVAATPLELLELERPALERLAQAHPGMQDMLEAYYLVRTQSDAAATLRSAAIDDPDLPRRAAEVLKAHFGEAHWDPRMRLKLAEALLKSGKQQEALPILAGLADELVRAGYTEKAVAILKRIERIEGRHTEQISLAPLKRAATPAPPAPAPAAALTPAPAPPRAEGEGGFNGWLLELVRESVERGEERRGPGTAPGLLMSPLFEDFSEEELLSLVRGLRLLEYGPGDVVITEGEDGNSVFVLTSGVVKVFVRNPLGHNVLVGKLGEGDFFGEISLLSGRPRSATITATGPCELLELDKPTLERVCAEHPRVRSVMEDIYIERASHPLAARIRGSSAQAEG